jgi:hypothetical protein
MLTGSEQGIVMFTDSDGKVDKSDDLLQCCFILRVLQQNARAEQVIQHFVSLSTSGYPHRPTTYLTELSTNST